MLLSALHGQKHCSILPERQQGNTTSTFPPSKCYEKHDDETQN